MEYTKQNFEDGQVLCAEHLNYIEDGILALLAAIELLENNTGGNDGTGDTGNTGGTESVASPIKYVESTDDDNLLNLRDFESGTYVLYGKFHPFSGSTASITFVNALLVNIITKTAGTHVQVFYPVNNCVQFLNITDDSYERTNVYLNDLLDHIGTLSNLTTTDKTNLVAAINEVKTIAENASSGSGSGGTGGTGADGYSPIATVTQTDNGAVISITDVNGTTTATINNGYSPVRGTDYWTADDVAEIKSYVDEAILGGEW